MDKIGQANEPGLRFAHVQEVRWGDLDALNHVNNSVYFRYIEEARVQLMQHMGLTLPSDYGAVLAHTALDFLRPLLYPASIRVIIELVRIGRSSLELNVYVQDAADETIVYARGKNVLVATDRHGVSRPWMSREIEALQATLT
ncbi:acyl-CoA thioesterase [Alcaligenes endophyticus]|uniref:Acyl-CoA thioesterase n=1 Tax=Alcaligenes endophyticus TaxID=1929088 RepID=A0ABT8EHT7_9BURK|nr:acyl-CoA thioesterase [Alcaligenes endophyticus]MCX5592202.1 acyl-CoA thioesterase [Alcaligenes endophyticus]MDN4120849.1 acyl-CoA thioesterase [Alcaligenes endophyticus]